jgi:hypothetical protein
MLLHRLVASTSSGAIGVVTQSSALIGSATTSQSSILGPPSAPSLGTYPWYLDSDASFHDNSFCSSFFFASFLPSLHCSYCRWISSFCFWTGHDCCVILDPDVCYTQDRCTSHLVGTGPHHRDSQHLWELHWLRLPSVVPTSLVRSAYVASSTSASHLCDS